MDEDLVVTDRLRVRAGSVRERFSHAGGPGGQGVNTSDSRVELTFDVAGSPDIPADLRGRILARLAGRLVDGRLVVVAATFRGQLANRRAARARLVALLREAAAPPPPDRRPTRPTRGSQRRRVQAKRHRAQIKQNRARPTA